MQAARHLAHDYVTRPPLGERTGVLDGFVEACDETRSWSRMRSLLSRTLGDLGFDSYALLTHAPPDDLRSLAVLVHNWPDEAITHLQLRDGNPLFEQAEETTQLIYWRSAGWRGTLDRREIEWLNRLCALRPGVGVSQGLPCPFIAVSCSLTAPTPVEPRRVRLAMHVATHAYGHIQFLQRPEIDAAMRLTAREREVLHRAVRGERPSVVAKTAQISDNTVWSHRQRALGRLGAQTPEQALWRMIETRQLFHHGRSSKPRKD